jgi:transcriptional regulator with XRE-family HTH domain
VTRAEKVAEAQSLRRQGLKHHEVAEQMGVARTTVSAYLNDPDGSVDRARKDSYRGVCESCGARTDGSNGRDAAPPRCKNCAPAANAKWSPDLVIQRIKEWADVYGEQPTATDWLPAIAAYQKSPRADQIRRRYESGDWPSTNTVRRIFGTWNAAIEAAGFRARPASREAA